MSPTPRFSALLLGVVSLCGLSTSRAQDAMPRWPAPELTDRSFREWLGFIRPAADELKWRQVRWHTSLSEAASEASRLQRPILLWAMNGHPCGET